MCSQNGRNVQLTIFLLKTVAHTELQLFYSIYTLTSGNYLYAVFQPVMLLGGKSPTPLEICCRSQFLEKLYFTVRIYKKKPFVPDAVPGRQINQNCSCCWACASDPPEKQLTALLISHSWIRGLRYNLE